MAGQTAHVAGGTVEYAIGCPSADGVFLERELKGTYMACQELTITFAEAVSQAGDGIVLSCPIQSGKDASLSESQNGPDRGRPQSVFDSIR